MSFPLSAFSVFVFVVLGFGLVLVWKGVCVVPQASRYTVERFGRYTRTLDPGLSFIVPFLDRIGHRVSVLERQLESFKISVITKDNVEIGLVSTVFFRIGDPSKTLYRIQNVELAIHTTATSIVRSAAGKLELDEIQGSRERMNEEVQRNLKNAAGEWGIEVTRSEILDVVVDEETKSAQRRQLNADRERRAVVAQATGEKESVELAAQADLYKAEKEAEAIRVTADADAYAIERKAEADAKQTKLLAGAIRDDGQPAVDFEVRKRQVAALGELAASGNAKTLVVPAEVVGVLGSLEALKGILGPGEGPGRKPEA